MIEPRTSADRVLSGPELLVALARVRRRLNPDLQVFADALAYIIVAVDHLVLHAHDSEETEN